MYYHDSYIADLRRIRGQIPSPESFYGKTVLVTGATGLIGSAVVDFFAQLNLDEDAGIRILAAGRSPGRLKERFGDRADLPGMLYYPFDALDPVRVGPMETKYGACRAPESLASEAKTGRREEECSPAGGTGGGSPGPGPGEGQDSLYPEYLIHAAGIANPAMYTSRPVETMMTTIRGTGAVLALAAAHPGSRLLFVSSSEVYGKKESPEPFKEEEYGRVDLLSPRSCYPVSRRAAETLCASYGEEKGIDFVIARPGHVYGPTMTETDRRVSSLFPREAAAGRDIVLKSSGSQRRSYCYVLDCVSALLTVLLRGERGTAYNISNSRSIATIREMAECFAAGAGGRVLFADPTQEERSAFNPMEDATLDASRLESLGWKGLFDLRTGTARTLACL